MKRVLSTFLKRGATDVSASKKKSATVAVSVAKWNPQEQDIVYKAYKNGTGDVISKRTFNSERMR